MVMCEFQCGYVKPKYREKAKHCYMDTDSFIVHIKTRHLCRHCKRCQSKISYFKL